MGLGEGFHRSQPRSAAVRAEGPDHPESPWTWHVGNNSYGLPVLFDFCGRVIQENSRFGPLRSNVTEAQFVEAKVEIHREPAEESLVEFLRADENNVVIGHLLPRHFASAQQRKSGNPWPELFAKLEISV